MLNLFILFHKCGNNYVKAVHRHDPATRFTLSVKAPEADKIASCDLPGEPVNVRCRNFGLKVLQRHGLLEGGDMRFLVFTRHPASFILSAVNYHLRGAEKWAMTRPEPHLGGVPLTTALNATEEEAERQIIAMKQFRGLYERQASFAECFGDDRFMQIRCEELFSTDDPAYFRAIAFFLRLGDRPAFIHALQQASPTSMKKLPRHSTGAFKQRDPYGALEPRAQSWYDEHFRAFADRLGY